MIIDDANLMRTRPSPQFTLEVRRLSASTFSSRVSSFRPSIGFGEAIIIIINYYYIIRLDSAKAESRPVCP